MTIFGDMPKEEGAESIARFQRDRLNAFLVPFSGEKPEETVRVELSEAAGDPPRRTVKLSLRPSLKMQGKDTDFTLQIAL
jgi:hypothetical protein